jgi:hypothetical protein
MSAWREALEAELFGGSDGDEPSAWDAVLAAELDLGGEPSAWDAVLAAELDPAEGFLDEAEGDLGDVPAEGDLDEAEGVLACLGDVLAEGDLDEAEGAGPAHAIVVAVHASRWSLMAIAGELRGPKDRLQVGRAVESLAKLVGLPSRCRRPPRQRVAQKRLAEHISSSPSFMSLVSLSEFHKLDVKGTKRCLLRYYSALYQVVWRQAVQMLHNLCDKVRAAGGSLVCCSEFVSYDETPLPVKVKAAEQVPGPHRNEVALRDADQAVTVAMASTDPHAKILQTEYLVSALFKVGPAYQEVCLELPCPLQVFDRGTAECYVECLQLSRKMLSELLEQFGRRGRHVMSDSDSSVLRAERALAMKDPDRAILHGFCRLHRISAIASNGVDKSMKLEVTGIINIALALQSSGAMRCFRRCLRDVLRRKLVVRRGSPGPAADRRRQMILETFAPVHPGQHSSFVDRVVIAQCANGNYDNKRAFEVYVAGDYDHQDVVHYVCVHFVRAVAGKPPRPYPRSRWTGARATLEKPIGLLMNMHGLFQDTFEMFCASFNVTKSKGGEPIGPLALEDAAGPEAHAEAHLPVDLRANPNAEHIEQKNKFMRCGLNFTSDGDSAGKLVIMKMVTGRSNGKLIKG